MCLPFDLIRDTIHSCFSGWRVKLDSAPVWVLLVCPISFFWDVRNPENTQQGVHSKPQVYVQLALCQGHGVGGSHGPLGWWLNAEFPGSFTSTPHASQTYMVIREERVPGR